MAAPPRPFEKKLASAQLFAKIQLMNSRKNPNPKEEEKRKKEEAKKAAKVAKRAEAAAKTKEKKKVGDADKTSKRLKKLSSEKESVPSRLEALKEYFGNREEEGEEEKEKKREQGSKKKQEEARKSKKKQGPKSATEQEERYFFDNNVSTMFALINELFLMPNPKKGKYKSKELIPFLEILKKFMAMKTPLVTKENSPQAKDIERILEKCLVPVNKHALRLEAFETLLYMLSLKPANSEPLVKLFSQAIVLHPFKNTDSWKASLDARADSALTAPTHPTLSDSILMMEAFFNYVVETSHDHKYWFTLWLENYVGAFYPETCGDRLPLEAFRLCPPEVQFLLLQHMESWAHQRHPFFEDFWAHQDGQLMMAILRQTMQLHLEWVEISNAALMQFRQWIVKRNEADPAEKTVERKFWRDFSKNICLAITAMESNNDEALKDHISLVQSVVTVLTSLATSTKVEESVRHSILLIFLDAVYELLNRNINRNSRTPFSVQMASPLTQTLLTVWVQTRSESPELWDALGEKLSALTEWKDVVSVWKEKVLQLTVLLVDQLYTPPDDLNPAPAPTAASIKAAMASPKKKDTIPKEAKWASLVWTKENSYFAWNTIFNILGDFNRFKNSENFELAMSAVWDIVEMLSDAQEQLPFDVEKPIPLMETWITGLIEGCYLPTSHLKGKLYVYRILHKFFCQHETPIGVETLSHFYRVILKGLKSESSAEVYELLNLAASYHLLPLNLPGAFVLIVPFLRCLDQLLVQTSGVPENVQHNCVTILNGFISYPNHFEKLEYPNMLQEGDETKISADELRSRITALQHQIVKQTSSASLRIAAIWGLVVSIIEDIHSPAPRDKLIADLAVTLVAHVVKENEQVAKTSLEALSVLSQYSAYFEKNKNTAFNIANRLLDCIGDLLKSGATEGYKETIISTVFYTLGDYLLSCGFLLQEDRSLQTRVFKSVHQTLNETSPSTKRNAIASSAGAGSAGLITAGATAPAPGSVAAASTSGSSQMLSSSIGAQGTDPARAAAGAKVAAVLSKGSPGTLTTGKEELAVMKEAAEALLTNLLNRYNNFPCPAGPDQMSSPVPPEDDLDNVLYFMYNDHTLVSLYETTEQRAPDQLRDRIAVVTLRDASGRYTWKAQVHYEDISRDPTRSRKSRKLQKNETNASLNAQAASPSSARGVMASSSSAQMLTPGSTKSPRAITTSNTNMLIDYGPQPEKPESASAIKRRQRKRGDQPLFSALDPAAASTPLPNQLEELLGYISEQYPECLTEETLKERLQPIPNDSKVAKFIEQLKEQTEVEDRRVESYTKTRPPVTELRELSAFERHEPASHFHACRLLLTHLGLLTPENMRHFKLVDPGPKFVRMLHLLDKSSARENVKIGVMYVREGQEHQYDIFRNQNGSKLYQGFAAGLGWLVNLKNHAGFFGGLVPTASPSAANPHIGTTAYFFADRNFEVIFHEAVRLPTDPKDPNQVEKKKHIGNDIVNIIWSEHRRDYKPTTVTSQFNFAHIVIYPLHNGLFRVQIHRKPNVEQFGPLQDGMVVPKRILSLLVRQTAMHANRVVRFNQPGYERPFPTRKGLITKIAESYKKEVEFKDFIGNLFIVPPREKAGIKDEKEEKDATTPGTPGGQN